MIFDWTGLHDELHFILVQKPDPLKYCNYALPFPLPIGLPFMPCDLPNEYELISTDSTYQQEKQTHLTFEEETTFLSRFLLPASHRPFSMVAKDYYNHTPYKAFRDFNRCFSSEDRPTLTVHYQDRYIGRVIEDTILNCCCSCFGMKDNFQEFTIHDSRGDIAYRVVSKTGQRGQFVILPCGGFDTITYYIIEGNRRKTGNRRKISQKREVRKEESEPSSSEISSRKISSMTDSIGTVSKKAKTSKSCYKEIEVQDSGSDSEDNSGQIVGEIIHLFNGFSEYTSKNDKYGLTMPEDATEEDKCLLIHCALFIDYLLFQNF